MPITAKWPVRQPRKRKPLAEAPPVLNIDRASEILPSLNYDVGQEAQAKRIHCRHRHLTNRPACRLARSNYTNEHPPI